MKLKSRTEDTENGCREFMSLSAVGRDARLAEELRACYLAELISAESYRYRSLVGAKIDSALSGELQSLACEATSRCRTVGELILSLGGNPTVETTLAVASLDPSPETCKRTVSEMLQASKREEKAKIDLYQTMLGRNADRVIRSVLVQMIGKVNSSIDLLDDLIAVSL